MSLSGSYSFALNRDQMISRAFSIAGLSMINGAVASDDLSLAIDILNAMIKDWEGEGICMWKRKQAILFPDYNTNLYNLNSTTGNCTNSYISTTSSATSSASATTITLTSVTGMSVSDYIGIELDAGTRSWGTISAINTGTKVVTFTPAIATQATSGITVITYTTKINKPLKIIRATVFDLANNSESQMGKISFDEYFDTPVKTQLGRPNNFYYDRQLSTGQLYLFPTPDSVKRIIKFTYQDAFEDMVSTTDLFDFPSEWTLTILYNLIVELLYAYKKLTELPMFEQKAKMHLEKAKMFSSDDETLTISLDRDAY
jgi:hypothetical protein